MVHPHCTHTALILSRFVFMMHPHGWGSWVYEVESTTTNHSTAPSQCSSGDCTVLTFGKGGQQEARGTQVSHAMKNYGGSFYISHRMEYLDTAGEWYLDEGTETLYLAAAGAPPAEVITPVVEEIFQLFGSQQAPVDSVRISGLTHYTPYSLYTILTIHHTHHTHYTYIQVLPSAMLHLRTCATTPYLLAVTTLFIAVPVSISTVPPIAP
jgi:hypothetical protein